MNSLAFNQRSTKLNIIEHLRRSTPWGAERGHPQPACTCTSIYWSPNRTYYNTGANSIPEPTRGHGPHAPPLIESAGNACTFRNETVAHLRQPSKASDFIYSFFISLLFCITQPFQDCSPIINYF
jgi:hypothetical protein